MPRSSSLRKRLAHSSSPRPKSSSSRPNLSSSSSLSLSSSPPIFPLTLPAANMASVSRDQLVRLLVQNICAQISVDAHPLSIPDNLEIGIVDEVKTRLSLLFSKEVYYSHDTGKNVFILSWVHPSGNVSLTS